MEPKSVLPNIFSDKKFLLTKLTWVEEEGPTVSGQATPKEAGAGAPFSYYQIYKSKMSEDPCESSC